MNTTQSKVQSAPTFGTVGTGRVVHVLWSDRPICGCDEDRYTGRRSYVRTTTGPATCKRCTNR